MIELSLVDIAVIVDGELQLAAGVAPETLVHGVVDTDSRKLAPGGIFFAKPGEVTDGHLFVGAALAQGARLAIVEHRVDEPISQIVVANVVEALAKLARAVVTRVREGGTLRVVGVTGSNGKTTTKNLVHRILQGEGETVAPINSFNNEVGAPLTMLKLQENTRFLVCEFGATAPDSIAPLAQLAPPDVSIVLMIGKAHAGAYASIEETATTKAGLLEHTLPGGTAVLNVDDPRVWAMRELAESRGLRVLGFGVGDEAAVRASRVEVTAKGTSALVHIEGRQLELHMRILGAHHVHNALAAIAACSTLGVDPAVAIERIEQLDFPERWRMQPLGNEQVRIYNDAYNASPDSMAAALRTLVQITGPEERAVAVLGTMAELGENADEEHDRVALLAVRLNIPRIVYVGEATRRMYLVTIAEGSWDGEAVHFADADAAYDYLREELRAGDRVLVKSSNSAGLRLLGDRVGESFS